MWLEDVVKDGVWLGDVVKDGVWLGDKVKEELRVPLLLTVKELL